MLIRCSTVLLLFPFAIALAGDGDTPKGKLTKEEQRVVDLTNEARKKEGLEPLTVSLILGDTARKHSQTMAKKRVLAHEIDGVTPPDRLKEAGYKYMAYGENIFMSKRKDADVGDTAIQWWLKSEQHRANLLAKEFTEVGVGVATNGAGETYITQVFGTPRK